MQTLELEPVGNAVLEHIGSTVAPADLVARKPFAYCVQAKKPYGYFFELQNRTSDLFIVYWDKNYSAPRGARSKHLRPKTSWNQGRNTLTQMVLESGNQYEYVIYLDDDINVTAASGGNGFREFERLLLKYNPVAAVPDFVSHISHNPNKKDCYQHEAITVQGTDAVVWACHWDALASLMPYPLQYDKQSWWASQHVLVNKLHNLYPGGQLMFPGVCVGNLFHTDWTSKTANYKGGFECFPAIDKAIKSTGHKSLPWMDGYKNWEPVTKRLQWEPQQPLNVEWDK